mmetsp:Transcript_152/g.336  ORF Transcript_152/g.336 Transcript_152/m.336 type:complete len:373 (-) Transcript_152:375-1493(-)|eukprot:CAMPEP_0202866190 /NCGR_PEP_ID=MMETSP1391-20130828/7249_1 /ASSEMBLY_ACC=CAM_ASM_000867 /TAXON_ID=1034604 /ORGANISM="Chlamydomonas leiostraca, Strain SAG 11-49" /LENGTH=372 /DNA_ID=CAMNT_0049546115 /DNA_START=85 /DNA_END=1203 /DNA_ORIENTATION=-
MLKAFAGPSRAVLTACRAYANAASGWQHTGKVVPGSTIEVHSTQSPVVVHGASAGTEQVTFRSDARWNLATGKRQDTGNPSLVLNEGPTPARLEVTAPEKWISYDIESKGGAPVHVSKVVEASLAVRSHGGDVELGAVRAYSAHVHTMGAARCGALRGNELSGSNVELRTGRGAIDLKRLIGQRVQVELHNAPLRVGALYAENIVVHTGGAAVDIGTLDCSGHEANIETEGGKISVNSLDGNANLFSRGGDVEVHLHAKIGSVRIASSGGTVRVAVSPQSTVAVAVRAARVVHCQGTVVALDPRTHERVAHFAPDGSGKQPRYGTLSEGVVSVDAGEGTVEIERVGWFEKVKQRMVKPGAPAGAGAKVAAKA